jgi:hypothetical protein
MSYQEYLARGRAKLQERYREERNIEVFFLQLILVFSLSLKKQNFIFYFSKAPNMNDLFEDLASEQEVEPEVITMDKPIDSSNIGYRLLV